MDSILEERMDRPEIADMMDLSANLPDELLCLVLNNLSLSDKLRLESVNSKFKRCVRAVLSSNPQALEIDLTNELLNGHKVMIRKYPEILHRFCQKAKFDRVVISIPPGPLAVRMEQMDEILPILFFSSNDCLSPVTTLELDAAGSPPFLHRTIDKCPNLKTIRFNFQMRTLNQAHDAAFFVDLHTALKDKALTEIKLTLYRYWTENVIDAFGSLAPNKLQKLDLTFDQMPALDLGRLVSELRRCNAWAALQEINFGTVTLAQLNQLANSTQANLPLLQKCNVQLLNLEHNQFVATLTSLFGSPLPIAVGCRNVLRNMIGCHFLNQIRPLQAVHRGLQVQFRLSTQSYPTDFISGMLKFVVGNGSFEQPFFNCRVCSPACVQCHSFYPIALAVIVKIARRGRDWQLQICQLDRCRVGNVVNNVNAFKDLQTSGFKAVSATMNEARDKVVVTFEARYVEKPPPVANASGEESKLHLRQFNVTLACGHCISIACVGCLLDH